MTQRLKWQYSAHKVQVETKKLLKAPLLAENHTTEFSFYVSVSRFMNSKANSQFLLTFPFPHRLSLFLGPKLFSDPSFSYKLQFRKQSNNCPCSHHKCFCFRSQLGRPSKRVCCVCLLLINLTKATLHLQSSSYFSVFFNVFHHTLVTQSDGVVPAYS